MSTGGHTSCVANAPAPDEAAKVRLSRGAKRKMRRTKLALHLATGTYRYAAPEKSAAGKSAGPGNAIGEFVDAWSERKPSDPVIGSYLQRHREDRGDVDGGKES